MRCLNPEIRSNSCPVLGSTMCFAFVSHLRVDKVDNYILYWYCMVNHAESGIDFYMFLHKWIFYNFKNNQ